MLSTLASCARFAHHTALGWIVCTRAEGFARECLIIGSEIRNWLLLYSLPVLKGVLPNPYLSHSSAGSWATSTDSDRITQEDIRDTELYLNEFKVKYSALFGKINKEFIKER